MIIGAVGKNATGKDYLLEYISHKYCLPMLSIGDIVRELAEREGVEPTRENLHCISKKYMGEFGQTFFPKQVADRIERMAENNVLVSGIRPFSDVEYLKSRFGKGFLLICVKISDDKNRFERMLARNSKRDPHSFQDLIKQDEEEERIFHTSVSEAHADITVYNDYSLADFNNEIDLLFEQRIKPLL